MKPVQGASVWLPSRFANESAWSYVLKPDERRAIYDYARGGPLARLARVLAEPASTWISALTDGPGFVMLRGFPTDFQEPRSLEHAYLGVAGLIGRPVGQDRSGGLITHIRDEGRRGPDVRRYQTTLGQDFHSDASDLVGLLCLRPAFSGGTSRIVSAHTVYNHLLERDPESLRLLHEPMPWSRHTQRSGGAGHFELAPIADAGGRPRVTVVPWFIRQSQTDPDVPRLTPEQLGALDAFEAVTRDPALQLAMDFEAGDLQLLNNTTVLHARDAYVDSRDPSARRHLLRTWLALSEPVADDVLRGCPSVTQ